MFHGNVLVVDDDDLVREVMKLILTAQLPLKVETASNGYEAVEKLSEKNYDLVLLDYEMPGMNGIELCREIRKAQPSAIIIMITGRITGEDERKTIKACTNAFHGKPVKMSDLFFQIQQLLVQYALHYMNGLRDEPFLFRLNGDP